MEIRYRPTGERDFDFVVKPERKESRVLYAPDEEIRGHASFEAGRVTIYSLTIGRAKGLSTSSLRAIPLGELREQIIRDLREHPDLLEVREGQIDFRRPRPRRRATSPTTRVRRAETLHYLKRHSPKRLAADDFYRHVAQAYLSYLETHPRDPIAALTAELRKSKRHENLSRNTVTSWVRTARERMWLSSAVHGKAGADPGVRLLLHQLEKGVVEK